MTRQQFIDARNAGRKFCWATFNERQDFILNLGNAAPRIPIRDITNEPNHHHREIGKESKQ